jgi:hypothetical protein
MCTYALLRNGGIVDFVRCHPAAIAFLKQELQGFVIGEGRDRQAAERDARQSGLWFAN